MVRLVSGTDRFGHFDLADPPPGDGGTRRTSSAAGATLRLGVGNSTLSLRVVLSAPRRPRRGRLRLGTAAPAEDGDACECGTGGGVTAPDHDRSRRSPRRHTPTGTSVKAVSVDSLLRFVILTELQIVAVSHPSSSSLIGRNPAICR